jgi:hypothetical protein
MMVYQIMNVYVSNVLHEIRRGYVNLDLMNPRKRRGRRRKPPPSHVNRNQMGQDDNCQDELKGLHLMKVHSLQPRRRNGGKRRRRIWMLVIVARRRKGVSDWLVESVY